MVGQHPGRRRADRVHRGQRVDDRVPERGRVPVGLQQPEVERQVQLVRPDVPGQPLVAVHPDLADRHPVRVRVEDPADQPVHVVHLRRRRSAGPARRSGSGTVLCRSRPVHVRQAGGLRHPVRHVDAEAVDAAVQPEPHRRLEVRRHRRVGPVQVRLLGREQVQVPLPVRDPGPGRAAEDRVPVVRRLGAVLAARPSRNTYCARSGLPGAAASAAAKSACRSEVWLGTRSIVTLRPQLVRVGDQRVEVGQVAEQRVDVARVGDVVAVVDHRRRVERRQPQRVDAEQVQVAEPVPDAGQVADAVAVGVGEAAHVHLVEDRGPPPRLPPAGARARTRGCRASGAQVSSAKV